MEVVSIIALAIGAIFGIPWAYAVSGGYKTTNGYNAVMIRLMGHVACIGAGVGGILLFPGYGLWTGLLASICMMVLSFAIGWALATKNRQTTPTSV